MHVVKEDMRIVGVEDDNIIIIILITIGIRWLLWRPLEGKAKKQITILRM